MNQITQIFLECKSLTLNDFKTNAEERVILLLKI